MDDELAGDVIERAQHRHLLGLSRRRDAQVCSGLRPGAREIGMRQRLAFVAVEKNDVARFGLTLRAVAGASRSRSPRWPSGVPSACAGAAASGTFFSQRLGQLRAADAHSLTRFDLGA